MKYLLLIALILSITSCGKGGGGSRPSGTENSNEIRPHCDAVISKNELFALAVSANRARVECGLKEDEAIRLFGILGP